MTPGFPALYHLPMPAPTVTAILGPRGFTTRISANGHLIVADEPESAGGADEGPDPYALLLSSLAACKLMTLRMYADRKQWPMTGASIQLSHTRQHAADCRECESTEGSISRIEATLELEGELTDDQRSRLAEIADHCPVHRTISGEVIITTALAKAP
jgi:putative redox protein